MLLDWIGLSLASFSGDKSSVSPSVKRFVTRVTWMRHN